MAVLAVPSTRQIGAEQSRPSERQGVRFSRLALIHTMRACLVVYDGHVVVANLLQRIRQVCVRLGQLAVQHDAPVVKPDALLIIAQLVVDGADQQQQVCAVRVLRVDLRVRQRSGHACAPRSLHAHSPPVPPKPAERSGYSEASGLLRASLHLLSALM